MTCPVETIGVPLYDNDIAMNLSHIENPILGTGLGETAQFVGVVR